jgi:hypothetical protein
MPDAKPNDVDFPEETDSPTYADDRNFYKVEKWTRDGTKVDCLLYAGNSLGGPDRMGIRLAQFVVDRLVAGATASS